MYELEKQVKDIIIAKYGSLKRFCEEVDMPWSTLDSILKRGFANSNIGNVLKVARELDIEVEPLAFGVLQKRVPTPADPLQLTVQEEHLVISFRSLNEDGREKVVEYVVDLAGMEKYQHDPFRDTADQVEKEVLEYLSQKERMRV